LNVPPRPAGIVDAVGPDRPLLIELSSQPGSRRAVDVVITCVQAYQRLAGNRRGSINIGTAHPNMTCAFLETPRSRLRRARSHMDRAVV